LRVLLDTNVLLIWLGDTARVTPSMRAVMLSTKNDIYYSPLSIWECRIKAAKGALQVDDDLLEIVKGKDFKELPFLSAHADETKNLPPIHQDPFDRGLIGQAKVEGMTLLSTDSLLTRYDVSVHLT
jgi:PIN domain nuclease of toxin-antitoxin system